MKAIAYPFTIQRFRAAQNYAGDVWPRTFKALAANRAAADEVWFSTGIGFPRLGWHREHSARLAAAAGDLRSAGILPSVEIQAVLGHGDSITRYRDDISGKTWRGWTGPDGAEAEACSCPTDPALLAYFQEVARIYAAWRPASLWFDDDIAIRSRAPGIVWPDASRLPGCWCDRCIAGFSRREGRGWTRESLAVALRTPGSFEVFDRWADYCFDNLADLVGAIGKAVCEVSPETVLGYQHGCVYRGRDSQLKIYRRLREVSGHGVRSRPGGGAYLDHDPRQIVEKTYDEGAQMSALGMPDFIEAACPEIESCPRTFSCKTARGVVLESFLALSQGMNSLSYFIADGEFEDPEWYGDALFAPIAAARPFLEEYARLSEGALPAGATLPQFGRDTCSFQHSGIPLLAAPGRRDCAILTDAALAAMDDAEVAEALKGDLLLDGKAAAALAGRGFSEDLAGMAASPFDGTVREYFTDDPLVAGLRGCAHAAGAGVSFRLAFSDTSAKVRVLSEVLDGDGRRLGDSTCLVERADGSRFAVLGLGGFELSAASSRRLVQTCRVADWVARGRLPCLLDTPALAALFARVDPDGTFRSAVVVNPRIDTLGGARLRLRGVPTGTDRLVWRDMDLCRADPGARTSVAVVRDGADAIVEIPFLAPWGAGYFATK